LSQNFGCKIEVGPKERGMMTCGSIEVRANKGLMICGLRGGEGRGCPELVEKKE
jgi:hypothetical protein